MGRVKDLMIERHEQADDRLLAEVLGIAYEELIQLEWEIKETKNAEGFVYEYLLEFSDDSSSEILGKIDRVESGKTVRISPWELDSGYDYINDQLDAITEAGKPTELFNLKLISY